MFSKKLYGDFIFRCSLEKIILCLNVPLHLVNISIARANHILCIYTYGITINMMHFYILFYFNFRGGDVAMRG